MMWKLSEKKTEISHQLLKRIYAHLRVLALQLTLTKLSSRFKFELIIKLKNVSSYYQLLGLVETFDE